MSHWIAVRAVMAGAICCLLLAPAFAFTLATWNAEQASVESVTRREPTLRKLGEALRTNAGGELPEVLVLQEITSYAAAVRIARSLGYASATVAVSDAGNDREIWPFALEIAIVTTRPVISVTSHQSRADERYPPFMTALPSGDITQLAKSRAAFGCFTLVRLANTSCNWIPVVRSIVTASTGAPLAFNSWTTNKADGN